ncbi:Alpha/beta hydrolase family protein [Theileria parva strain Muguga]|uniref:Alpha/beta hydrolase family protein n=1 Tax=Theileria parva strain Muguga TaxID=333668 RepID=UPI001C61CB6A|nr:Alpha/beta hydrolase family protein [Theileria parva strain Muguga]EAN32637.2 Alpha/beta hydrolase family protein [Theileria parva strain Muguga]
MGNAKSIANSIIFPAPQASYDHNLPELVWVPKNFASKDLNIDKPSSRSFPVLFIRSPQPSSLFFIYLHANCCDIGLIKPELYDISEAIGASIVAVEYPGYGLSPEISVTTGPSVNLRVIATFHFLLSLGVHPSSIVFFGRSIGTGPAACIAAHFVKKGIKCGGVILQAPYVSIHKIVQEYFPLGSWLIDNFWDLEQALKDMSPSVPLLIIHGLLDEIVPVSHGQRLYDSYESENKMADFQPNSKHNYYSINEDLIVPIRKFLNKFNISAYNPPMEITLPRWCLSKSKNVLRRRRSNNSDKSFKTTTESMRSLTLSSSRTSSIHTRTQVSTARTSVSASSLLQESIPPELDSDVNRSICHSNFSSSLEGLCQRNSINNEDISDMVNDAITRNNNP